jgi:hypothetical protein
MPSDDFAPYLKLNGCFVVQNISPQVKTIKIFNYPINYGGTRDILQIPGVSEGDIRASLLKGELNHKVRARDIIVLCSDIDLLQFNAAQKLFLQSAGIVNGLSASSSGGIGFGIVEEDFVDSSPNASLVSGAVRVTNPSGNPFPTQIVWFTDNSQTEKIVEKLITYNGNQVPTIITWNVYNTDGITINHSVTDVITYTNNVFETQRIRTII